MSNDLLMLEEKVRNVKSYKDIEVLFKEDNMEWGYVFSDEFKQKDLNKQKEELFSLLRFCSKL